ncbi:alpha-hydroxy acid oxidase [Lysinibacillus sp. NPDC093688]|uniref:alpha-hydroxy acid oxidase n=1 Tax=Lysinibacillus sp. NPDC093688 TaxID=3390577 RepID=UPI003D06E0B4
MIPRFLQDVSSIDTSIELFGKVHPTPLLFAPVGMNKMAHDEGELAVARAADQLKIPYIQSTVSSYALEDVAQAAPTATKWFQLYWSTNEEIAYSMAARAEAAGFEAINCRYRHAWLARRRCSQSIFTFKTWVCTRKLYE